MSESGELIKEDFILRLHHCTFFEKRFKIFLHIPTATFHQGDERVSSQSRGKQCAFKSLSAARNTCQL